MYPQQHLTWLSVLVTLVAVTNGYRMYQVNIPNGEIVPHPCKPNYIWRGVGHENVLGGGARNPFGAAFAAANFEWTTDLCNADSDGDGNTNGEELGDPSCVWSKGDQPQQSLGLTHPGVCEPTDSAECIAANAWEIDCSEGLDYTCPGIADQDTVNLTLLFDRTRVPSEETTYMCQVFDIPNDKAYHLFGTKPEIDNLDVMHHTILYGCVDEVAGFETPTVCGMGSYECSTMLGAWTVGSNGDCLGEDAGFLVGKGHFTKVLLEHHWNNPAQESNYYDASGMTLFLTPNLRENNLGYLMTGQESLEIPPGESNVPYHASCPSSCTNRIFSGTVYINTAHLHMHYLGDSGTILHYRNGQLITTLFNESTYSYDLPVFNEFSDPIEFRPGDELVTECRFKSTSRSEITYFGDGTSDEMCYGFMTYYPAENGPDACVSWEEYDYCEILDFENSASASEIYVGVVAFFSIMALFTN